ncbi:MAG: DNA-binding protein [Candidatus Nitrosocaldaceae archaeon]|nr:MAG: DNA-binding protein [Candidatus Nitrosocaldaceae archaeon]
MHRKYEEYAYVLDVLPNSRSKTVKGREGLIIQAIGEDKLTLLELLGMPNMDFEIGERLYIGKEGRTKVISVLGRLDYNSLTSAAKDELPYIIENIVKNNEKKFIDYINHAQPLTPRIHSLELIPGIGKTYLMQILNEREKKPFESFEDLQQRTGIREPIKIIAKRIHEEISGNTKMNIFVKR